MYIIFFGIISGIILKHVTVSTVLLLVDVLTLGNNIENEKEGTHQLS